MQGTRDLNPQPSVLETDALPVELVPFGGPVALNVVPAVPGADKLRADGFDGDVKILTSCPACFQGLSRFNEDSGTTADYIVVEIARHLLGENWMPDYVNRANDGGIERVLV